MADLRSEPHCSGYREARSSSSSSTRWYPPATLIKTSKRLGGSVTIEAVGASTTPKPRPSVADRMTQILDVFLLGGERLLLEDVRLATGLPRSTTFRILTQLVELDWLEHTNRGYRLGPRARGFRVKDPDELRCAAAPVLNELHVRTGGVAHLSVLEGRVVRYLDKIGGTAAASIPSRVGSRVAPDRTVAGRCMLALMPAEEVDSLLSVGDANPRTPEQMSRLHSDLDRIRARKGLAMDSGEHFVMGIAAAAAPVYGPDGVAGAISLAVRNGVSAREFAPWVVLGARRVSHAMGA